MSATNKVLIGAIAVVAFIVGAVANSARVSDEIDVQALLNAQLIIGDASSASADNIKDQLGKLTLVNFWATWCAPCREEMPIFETMYRGAKSNGFQIIGVAIDSQEKAQPMLDSMDITYPILYAEQTGMMIMETAGNPQGLLPYSLLLDEKGRVIEQILGRIHEEQIKQWLDSAGITLNSTATSN